MSRSSTSISLQLNGVFYRFENPHYRLFRYFKHEHLDVESVNIIWFCSWNEFVFNVPSEYLSKVTRLKKYLDASQSKNKIADVYSLLFQGIGMSDQARVVCIDYICEKDLYNYFSLAMNLLSNSELSDEMKRSCDVKLKALQGQQEKMWDRLLELRQQRRYAKNVQGIRRTYSMRGGDDLARFTQSQLESEKNEEGDSPKFKK